MKDELPRRALYLCDQEVPECKNSPICGLDCFRTQKVIHAKNGPVTNIRDWNTRFSIEIIDGVVYYWEKDCDTQEES